MNGDGMCRTQCVNQGRRTPFVVWRILNGATQYHRSTPARYAPS